MLKLAIYDWNGTLLNDIAVAFGSVDLIFNTYGIPVPTLDEYRNEIEANFMPFYWNHGIPPHVTGADLNIIRKGFLESNPHGAQLHDRTHDLLRLTKTLGMKNAVVSGEMGELLHRNLKKHDLLNLLDQVHGDVRNKREVLREVCGFFGMQPKDAFYLDDTFEGLTSAKEAGLFTIGVTHGYASDAKICAAKPDFACDSLDEVIYVLARRGDV